ncbi:hypothetical protein Hdeb2414_s0001g00041191 [Helianthus debilis subsp. tardiflorus]
MNMLLQKMKQFLPTTVMLLIIKIQHLVTCVLYIFGDFQLLEVLPAKDLRKMMRIQALLSQFIAKMGGELMLFQCGRIVPKRSGTYISDGVWTCQNLWFLLVKMETQVMKEILVAFTSLLYLKESVMLLTTNIMPTESTRFQTYGGLFIVTIFYLH